MNWKKTLATVAPTIASAIGSPAAGMAVKFLAGQFLGDENASQETIAKAITHASPDDMLRLKSLEQDFLIKMRELDIDVIALHNEDRKNARQLLSVTMWPQVVLSFLFVGGYFGIMVLLISYHEVKLNDQILGVLTTVVGVLTAAIPMILQFWFGSSQGSKEKTKQLGVTNG